MLDIFAFLYCFFFFYSLKDLSHIKTLFETSWRCLSSHFNLAVSHLCSMGSPSNIIMGIPLSFSLLIHLFHNSMSIYFFVYFSFGNAYSSAFSWEGETEDSYLGILSGGYLMLVLFSTYSYHLSQIPLQWGFSIKFIIYQPIALFVRFSY